MKLSFYSRLPVMAFVPLLSGAPNIGSATALAAILVLIEFGAIRTLWQRRRSIVVAVATAVGTFLSGSATGISQSLIRSVYIFSRLRISQRVELVSGKRTLVLEGPVTFMHLPQLAAVLDRVALGSALHLDFKGVSYIDLKSFTYLMNWGRRHAVGGGTLLLDWEALRARSILERPRLQANESSFRFDDSKRERELEL